MAELLNTLLQQEQQKSDSTLFISLYYPNNSWSVDQLKHHFKGHFTRILRESPIIGSNNHLYNTVLHLVLSKVEALDDVGQGIAVFGQVEANKTPSSKTPLDDTLFHISVLPTRPVTDCYIGRTFDLDQLIWLQQQLVPSLALHITQKKAEVFLLTISDFVFLHEEENPYFYGEKPTKYQNQHIPAPNTGNIHGSDSRKFEGRLEKENEQFLLEQLPTLKELTQHYAHLESLLVFYSQSFSDHIEKFEKEWHRLLPQIEIVTECKEYPTHEELRASAQEIKQQQHNQKYQELWQKAKDSKKFVTGWDAVSQAARDGKIDTLFIQPTVSNPGYLLDNQLLYVESLDGARPVRNMAPWLVKQVITSSGEVVLLDEEKDHPPVAAKLRF